MESRTGRRIQLIGAIFIGVGLVAAAAAHPALGGPIALLADPVFWPIDGLPAAPNEPLERLLAAIAGGLMVGWATMIVALGRGASVTRALLLGGGAWFAVDGIGSVLAGAPLNAVANLVFLALIVWAAAPARHDPAVRRADRAGT